MAADLLTDGEWREYEWMIRELGKLVPPGRAIRRNEQDRSYNSDARERVRPLSPERAIQAGRRAIVRDALRVSSYEHEERDGIRFVRMLRVPPRVARERARRRAHALFDPAQLADELARGADAHGLLGELSERQIRLLALALVERVREQAASSS